jgi:plastocyanin
LSQHSADPATFRSRWWTRRRIAPLVFLIGALAIAGCGGSKGTSSSASSETTSTPAAPATTGSSTSSSSESPPSAAAGSALSLSANSEGQLAYNTKSLSVKAGKVSIDFSNSSPLSHNVTVESSSGSVVGATPSFQGGSKTLSLNLKPGTYKFFCSVPGHRQAGMEGTLVVK